MNARLLFIALLVPCLSAAETYTTTVQVGDSTNIRPQGARWIVPPFSGPAGQLHSVTLNATWTTRVEDAERNLTNETYRWGPSVSVDTKFYVLNGTSLLLTAVPVTQSSSGLARFLVPGDHYNYRDTITGGTFTITSTDAAVLAAFRDTTPTNLYVAQTARGNAFIGLSAAASIVQLTVTYH
jgi:hypothetical protein